MFQSFEVTAAPQHGGERVSRLRSFFDPLGIDGLLVPRADEFQGEYVPAASERLSWLTGFTGSAGTALVTRNQAIVFVDGRYTTQLAEQVDANVFSSGDLVGHPPHHWLTEHAPRGFRLGIDPWLHTGAEVAKLLKALEALDGELVLLGENPVDVIWEDRPGPPSGRIEIHSYDHSGVLASEKIAAIAEKIGLAGHAAAILTDPSSVAWTFNIRGSDVPHTPHPLSRAIIHADGRAEIFLEKLKTGIEQEAYLAQLGFRLDPALFLAEVEALAKAGGMIEIDPELTPFAICQAIDLAGGNRIDTPDPARIPRAVKNAVELAGMSAVHLQDGAAMVEFLAWLDANEPGTLTEIDCVRALEATRAKVGERMQNPLRDIAFDTISGAGENGAIIHYRVSETSNRMLRPGELFLIDSGGQYVTGTTDITRTVAIGSVGDEQKRFFTLVLKGMIAISTARFPKGTRGLDIDPLARIALWKSGADYAHGTGHGVGAYLSVHEGPQRISRLAKQELLAGMVLSNEPGYYRPGHFGIRIENLVFVTPAEMVEGGDLPMLGFETLTFCPIDRRLILTHMLTREELLWLDAYHAETREKLLPLIDDPDAQLWLKTATAPLRN